MGGRDDAAETANVRPTELRSCTRTFATLVDATAATAQCHINVAVLCVHSDDNVPRTNLSGHRIVPMHTRVLLSPGRCGTSHIAAHAHTHTHEQKTCEMKSLMGAHVEENSLLRKQV